MQSFYPGTYQPQQLELMALYNNPLDFQNYGELELMNLDRSTAEQEMDEMVANSQLASMMDSLTQ